MRTEEHLVGADAEAHYLPPLPFPSPEKRKEKIKFVLIFDLLFP